MKAFIIVFITGSVLFTSADKLPSRNEKQYFITGEVYFSPCQTEPTTAQHIQTGDTIYIEQVGWSVVDSVKLYYP